MQKRGMGFPFKVQVFCDTWINFPKLGAASGRSIADVGDTQLLGVNHNIVANNPTSRRLPGPQEGILQPSTHFTPSEKKRLCRGLEKMGIRGPESLLFEYPCNFRLIESLKLLKNLGMTIPEQKQVVLESKKFVLSTHDAVRVNLDFLQSKIGLDGDGVKSVLLKVPQVVEYALDITMKPFLEKLRSAGFESDFIALMFKKKPQLLKVKIWKVDQMQKVFTSIGFSEKQFFEVVFKNPAVLDMSRRGKIYPFVESLHRIGLDNKDIVRVLATAPSILNMDWNASIQPRLLWFESELRLEKTQVLRDIFVHIPDLIVGNNLANYNKVVNILKSKGLRTDEWRSILSQKPNILGRAFGKKVSTLNQRFDFLHTILKKPSSDVVDFPAFLTHSFERHILCRVALIDYHGIDYTLLPIRVLFDRTHPDFPAGFEIEADSKFRVWWNSISRQEKLDAIKNQEYPV